MHPQKEWNGTLKCAIGPLCEETLETSDRNSIWKPLTTARSYSKSFRQPILSLSVYKLVRVDKCVPFQKYHPDQEKKLYPCHPEK